MGTKSSSEQKRRALIVDDEPMVLQLLTRHLERSGFLVSSAESAEQALELLKNAEVDVILLDVSLPGMSGFRAIEAFAEFSKAPVVMISGKADQDAVKDALLLGAKALLAKPLDLETLTKTLEEILPPS